MIKSTLTKFIDYASKNYFFIKTLKLVDINAVFLKIYSIFSVFYLLFFLIKFKENVLIFFKNKNLVFFICFICFITFSKNRSSYEAFLAIRLL